MAYTAGNQEIAWSQWHSSGTCSISCGINYDDQKSIWSSWTTTSATSGNTSGANTIDDELIWINWIQEAEAVDVGDVSITVSTDNQNQIWYNWNTTKVVYVGDTYKAVAKTKKERRAQKRKQKYAKKLAEKNRRRMMHNEEVKRRQAVAAETKAGALLEDLIGKEQMEVYKETGRILVHGENHDWFISNYQTEKTKELSYFDLTRNVKIQRIEKSKMVDLCVAHKGDDENKRIPVSDQVIGYLLHARHDEDNLKKTANDRFKHDLIMPKKFAVAS